MQAGLSRAKCPPNLIETHSRATCSLQWLSSSVVSSATRGYHPRNALHRAALDGSIERTVSLISSGSIDIDQQDPQDLTPLMIAAFHGHSRVARILLNKGASVSIVTDSGVTALHVSAKQGHLAVAKLLMEAGADLEAKTSIDGSTPVHVAASRGCSQIMRALIEAGADPNSRVVDGATSLYVAAQEGYTDAVKVLVRAKADPLLTQTLSGQSAVPLVIAAQQGHLEVVRWMIQEIGIEGCSGARGGVHALSHAATNQQVNIMVLLTDAGVVDNGGSLLKAGGHGCEASVKFLLQQGRTSVAYVNTCADRGRTPLSLAISGFPNLKRFACSPRIVRLLIDSGADAASAVRLTDDDGRGRVVFKGTPLALVAHTLRKKKSGGHSTQKQLHGLEGVRRLLLRVEAIHAVSWLWPDDTPSIVQAVEGTARTRKSSTPVTMMLPMLRRRAARPRVLLAALFRVSGAKEECSLASKGKSNRIWEPAGSPLNCKGQPLSVRLAFAG